SITEVHLFSIRYGGGSNPSEGKKSCAIHFLVCLFLQMDIALSGLDFVCGNHYQERSLIVWDFSCV
ncbi:MAG: hypothetical protein IKB96_00915, partial [Prevotella sp.]|nr:hypothetical protein [Prevotella sp.]